mmetsp:Transcript_45002/g.70569  ORF Transcript_45002/g.70569 Transcript_45002/m.70569 type:complete len:209 (-) Transcript_45002:27-653(-)
MAILISGSFSTGCSSSAFSSGSADSVGAAVMVEAREDKDLISVSSIVPPAAWDISDVVSSFSSTVTGCAPASESFAPALSASAALGLAASTAESSSSAVSAVLPCCPYPSSSGSECSMSSSLSFSSGRPSVTTPLLPACRPFLLAARLPAISSSSSSSSTCSKSPTELSPSPDLRLFSRFLPPFFLPAPLKVSGYHLLESILNTYRSL